VARFQLDPGATLVIGAGVTTERLPGRLVFQVEEGARVEIGSGSWLRCEIEPVRLTAMAGGQLTLGPDTWMNGCQLSAKVQIDVEEGAMIGPGTRIYDSEHAVDEDRPATASAVRIGEFTWIASDATVVAGVEIGGHCVIGSRAVVTRSIPAHSLAHGVPAKPRGTVGKRRAFM
jgi:UDP-3-O-[3-hydroxymyristoyl] glucosamine N-acyltransferase